MRLFSGCIFLLLFCAPVVAAAPAPLADAAEKSGWPKIEALLKERADANAAQADGCTALHWAAHHGNLPSVKALLAAGANAKAANLYGVTPLSLACVNGDAAIVTALLDAGAEANASLPGGETVLMTAARTGRVEPVKILLQRGAKPDATNRDGQTALMWAAAEGHAEAVESLIAGGADFRAKLKSGFTAFLFAARNGRRGVVSTLLKAGADPNEAITGARGGGRQPGNGTGALLLAVENGHFELAMDLVKAGADPNDARSGFTPLHALVRVRRPNRGDDLDGQPPPEGSGNLTSLEFIRRIVAAGAKVNARLERGGTGAGELSRAGATPFLLACQTADLEMMKLLVELGADPRLPNNDGSTPLMAAAGFGCLFPDEVAGTEDECLAAVAWLLSLGGADVNAADNKGETAMHGAAYKSLPMMVHLLTKHGAKVETWNHKNKHGWTPVMIAEGFRPGNFKPSVETLEALHAVMREAGAAIPAPTPRPDPAKSARGYDQR